MAPMRAANRRDVASVARRRKPVVHGGPNLAALDRRFSRTMVASDEENQAFTPENRVIEAAVDRVPCPIEVHPMKVDYPIGVDRSAPQFLVPAPIQRPLSDRDLPRFGLH